MKSFGPWVGTAGLLLLISAGCRALDPMQDQQKVLPYAESDSAPGGLAMRDPPAHTVPSATELLPAVATGLTPEGRPVQEIPIPVTPALLQIGQKRFEIFCAACHGLAGDGQSIVSRKMELRPPPSIHDFRDRPDGFFYQVITKGYGLMASYAMQLPVEERWSVVAYLRALQLSQRAPLLEAPPEVRARLEGEKP